MNGMQNNNNGGGQNITIIQPGQPQPMYGQQGFGQPYGQPQGYVQGGPTIIKI